MALGIFALSCCIDVCSADPMAFRDVRRYLVHGLGRQIISIVAVLVGSSGRDLARMCGNQLMDKDLFDA